MKSGHWYVLGHTDSHLVLFKRNEVKARGTDRDRRGANRRKRVAWMDMLIGFGSRDFNPCSLPFLCLSCLYNMKGHRSRGKGQWWCWGGVGWHIVARGTVFYRLDLIQNGVSSLSSIPHLISSNNLPFSSCPNRESQTWRSAQEKERERAKSGSFTCSLIH